MAPLFRTKCAADSAVIEPDAARAPDPHGVPRPRRVPMLQRLYPEWNAKGIARQQLLENSAVLVMRSISGWINLRGAVLPAGDHPSQPPCERL